MKLQAAYESATIPPGISRSGESRQHGERGIVRSLIALCMLMMLVGIAARFTFLDRKIFGNDEATTSLHVSGKTIAEYGATMFDGRSRTARELLRFQEPDPAHGVRDVVHSLEVEDPQHPPLYYLLERQWELGAGSSIADRRVLSAMFGAAGVLTAIWLGFELASILAGLIMGALVATSPFAIAYSQVAREYSLWLMLSFAASALFVRALRPGGAPAWAAYVVVCIAGLYTDALFTLIITAHAAALALPSRRRLRASIEFAVCLLPIAVAYAPWIAALTYGYTHGIVTNNAYLSSGLPILPFALKWIFNLGSLFYDADYLYPKTALLIIPGLIALGLAFAVCARRLRQYPQIGLIFALACVSAVALVLPDILHHEQRSTASRYLIGLWVACYAALAIGLAIGIRSGRALVRRASFGFVILSAATGLGSFAISASHDTWWVDGSTASIGSIGRAIERFNDPIVIYHATWGPGNGGPEVWDFAVVMVANIVSPGTTFVQYSRGTPAALPPSTRPLLLLDPTNATLVALRARGYDVVQIAGGSAGPRSADLAAVRRTVAHEREREGSGSGLSPIPSMWSVRTR